MNDVEVYYDDDDRDERKGVGREREREEDEEENLRYEDDEVKGEEDEEGVEGEESGWMVIEGRGGERREYIHTVTKLGTISIPVPLRRKYGITKGSKMKFIDGEDGIRLIPLVSLRNMFGIDRDRREMVMRLLREILESRRTVT